MVAAEAEYEPPVRRHPDRPAIERHFGAGLGPALDQPALDEVALQFERAGRGGAGEADGEQGCREAADHRRSRRRCASVAARASM